MITVAVKFCGGCNPAYERLEYLEKIKSAAGDRIRWVLIGDGGFEAILVISGCLTACPEEHLPDSVPILSLKTDDADPRSVADMLIEKGAKR